MKKRKTLQALYFHAPTTQERQLGNNKSASSPVTRAAARHINRQLATQAFFRRRAIEVNILFFLTPKSEVDYVYDDASIFKAMQIFDRHNYFSLPLINKKGRYIGAITTSDLLGCIKENFDLSVKASADFPVRNVKRIRDYKAVNGGSTSMEEIVSIALDQNFVPVVDDDYNFIGIITRKSIMNWMHERYHNEHPGEKNELK